MGSNKRSDSTNSTKPEAEQGYALRSAPVKRRKPELASFLKTTSQNNLSPRVIKVMVQTPDYVGNLRHEWYTFFNSHTWDFFLTISTNKKVPIETIRKHLDTFLLELEKRQNLRIFSQGLLISQTASCHAHILLKIEQFKTGFPLEDIPNVFVAYGDITPSLYFHLIAQKLWMDLFANGRPPLRYIPMTEKGDRTTRFNPPKYRFYPKEEEPETIDWIWFKNPQEIKLQPINDPDPTRLFEYILKHLTHEDNLFQTAESYDRKMGKLQSASWQRQQEYQGQPQPPEFLEYDLARILENEDKE